MKLARSRISIIVLFVIVLIVIAMIIAPGLIEPTSVKNARLAQETLRSIFYAEKVYQRLNSKKFGDLEQLKQQRLIKGFEGNKKDGYIFGLSEQNESFIIIATPLTEGSKYFLDQEGIVHIDSEDGAICLPDGSIISKSLNDK